MNATVRVAPSATSSRVVATPALTGTELYRFFRAGDEETQALRGVSLTVAAGEMVAVAGPSGSGKSTLLACLAGLDEPDGGTVRVLGNRLSHRSEQVRTRLRASWIGVLLQTGNLFDHLTVAQNVRLPPRLTGDNRRWATELLAELGIDHRADAYPSQLSGGELARAGLAVALANDPAVLLADEPTGELDEATEVGVLDLLVDRARHGVAVLVASHSPAIATAADRVLVLTDGQLTS